jgi:hypothetical protein
MKIGAMSQCILGHKRLAIKRQMEIEAPMLEDIFVFNIKRLVGTFDMFYTSHLSHYHNNTLHKIKHILMKKL